MRPAGLKMQRTFLLCHAALASQVAQHLPEGARALFRVVLRAPVREVERSVPDAKRSPASLAGRREGTELDKTACCAANGIKVGIRIHEVLLWSAPHRCVVPVASGAGMESSRREVGHGLGWERSGAGRELGAALQRADAHRGLLTRCGAFRSSERVLFGKGIDQN